MTPGPHAQRPNSPPRVTHLLSGLAIGGKERAALRLANRGIAEGAQHRLFLFDMPYRSPDLDFEPGRIPVDFRHRGPGLDVGLVLTLAKCLAMSEVDVVHAYNDTALCYAALAGVALGRWAPRLVATFHTAPSHVTRAARVLTRWSSGRADAVLAASDELAGALVVQGWVRRCDVIWNGIDLDLYCPRGSDGGWRDRLGIAAAAPLVVHVARFDVIKRHVDLIAAARLVLRQHPDAVFVLAGQGPLLPSIQRLAANLPAIHFVPHVADLAPLLRAADVFVLPSAHEVAPLALLEAMACGRAAVCTSVGGMPAILGEGTGEPAGLLVPPGAPSALAGAITRLLGDPALRARLGANARLAAGRFSFEQEWAKYRALYAGVPA